MVDLTINALFKRNPQSTEINRFLIRNKLDYFGQTKNTATLKDISTFYKELGEALVIVEDKYISEPPHKRQRIQQLVGTRDMVVNTLKKIHVRICRRLRLILLIMFVTVVS